MKCSQFLLHATGINQIINKNKKQESNFQISSKILIIHENNYVC
jgi:hypothetical protein